MNLIDQLNTAGEAQVSRVAFGVVDRIQDEKPGLQVQAMAVLFLLLCDMYGLDVRRVLERADRVIHDADRKYRPEIGAIRDYIKGELL